MLENSLVFYCAPTLAGIKTANLFSFSNRESVDKDIKALNRELNPKGVYVTVLSENQGRKLIYVYRPDRLMDDWSDEEVKRYLEGFGYNPCCLTESVRALSRKIREKNDFPHEIGLFLGFPVGDVRGFIENRGQNCKCSGCWKVYDDEKKARREFEKYQKCTDLYCRNFSMGVSINRLCV